MPSPESDITQPDGSFDFSGGVDSLSVPTLQSQSNPNGLSRNQLAWLINATVRDGGITPRSGWNKNGTVMPGTALFQGCFMYEPLIGNPYLIASIGGQIFQIDPTTGNFTNLSQQFNITNPAFQPKAYMEQAEQFLIIQAGDNVTLPMFWDGTILRRSLGLTSAKTIQATVTLQNVSDNTNVGVILPAGSINTPNVVIQNYASFQVPAVGNSVTISGTVVETSFGNPTGQTFTIPLRTKLTLKRTGGTVPTGNTVIGGNVSPGGPNGFSITNLDNFSLPALNATVDVLCDSISFTQGNPTFPSVGFFLPINQTSFTAQFVITAVTVNQAGPFELTAFTVAHTTGATVELPAATAMDYYMGRLWYAQGRNYCAGDIVGGPSGTLKYNFFDSVLKVTENPLVIGGDGFTVPSNAGNITAIFHNANLNSSLGQGQLFISTARSIYALQVPVTRTDWINANSQNQPLQTVVQEANGAVNDWSVVAVNGDNFFQSLEPAVRSLQQAIRYFGQWGNAQISSEVQRILQFNFLPLMGFANGAYFDNRLLMTALPTQLPQGVVHPALVAVDFMPISSFGITTQAGTVSQPVWEGSYEGVQVLQLQTGVFNGVQRCFALTVSTIDSSFEVWELVTGQKSDFQPITAPNDISNRITFQIEFPAFTWGEEFGLKKLVAAELWIDRLYGTAEFTLEYRPDGATCWYPWKKWKECSSRNSAEDVVNPISYPITQHGSGFRQTMTLPIPPAVCSQQSKRPSNVGYQIQPRLTVKGFCRVRGFLLHAEPVERKLYDGLVC